MAADAEFYQCVSNGNVLTYKHAPLIQGRMQDFSGGGPNFKIFGNLNIHAAKLRAFARGVWGHAPQENF